MLVSYRWLTSFSKLDMSLDDVVDVLTSCGLEIEGIHDLGVRSGKILCGRVLEKEQHPNADNLSLCKVDVGQTEPLRIVCGAKNHKVGDMVPVAIEGAILPGNFKIKKSKIRGEASEGMMCSSKELGFGDDHTGLMILPENWVYKLGTPFDAIIDIKVTPNRADALSILGIARDLTAYKRTSLNSPDYSITESGDSVTNYVTVKNAAPEACPRYVGRVIRNIKVSESPLWLKRAVESAGIRSINNVVDVTNFIMIELGQPLHAFDLDKVHNSTVLIRYANEGEMINTLDGMSHKLQNSDLLIADSNQPIALAGIMGCANTEITDTTTNVFLECAYFKPSVIRGTSKKLAKSTDSSYRFERGTDWKSLEQISNRTARLIQTVAGGDICSGQFFTGKDIIPEPSPIAFNADRVRSLLGMTIAPNDIKRVLVSLGFVLAETDQEDSWLVTPPSFRGDIAGSADLVEEVARIIGYSSLPATVPMLHSQAILPSKQHAVISSLKTVFTHCGVNEAKNYSFLDEQTVHQTGFDVNLKLANPLSTDYAVLRPSLIPGLLKTALYNLNRGISDVNLFEVGGVWDGKSDSIPPTERWQFAAVLCGSLRTLSWNQQATASDFFTGKAVAEALLNAMNVTQFKTETLVTTCKALNTIFHPGRSASLESPTTPLVYVGELHPRLSHEIGFKKAPIILFGWIDKLEDFVSNSPDCEPISQFPVITRDLALVTDTAISNAQIVDVITKRAKSILKKVQLFDVYTGEHMASGKKSLAYSLTFSADDRTLTDDEVNTVIEKILTELNSKLQIELRS